MRAKGRHPQTATGHAPDAQGLAIVSQIETATDYLAVLAHRSRVPIGATLRLDGPINADTIQGALKAISDRANLVTLLLESSEMRSLSASELVRALREAGLAVAAVILEDSKDWPGAYLMNQAGAWVTASFDAVLALERLFIEGWCALPGPRAWVNVQNPALRAWLSSRVRDAGLGLGSARSSDFALQISEEPADGQEDRPRSLPTLSLLRKTAVDGEDMAGVDAILQALKGLVSLSANRPGNAKPDLPPPKGFREDRIGEILDGPSRLLSFGTGLRLLSDAGVPVPDHHLVDSPSAAARHAQAMGGQVDLHLSAPSLDPDAAGAFFKLGISSPPLIRLAFSSLVTAGIEAGHKPLGVVVMPQVSGPFARIDAVTRKGEGRLVKVRIEDQTPVVMRAPLSPRDAAVLAAGAGAPAASIPGLSALLYAVAWLFSTESEHLDRMVIQRIPVGSGIPGLLPFVWVKGD